MIKTKKSQPFGCDFFFVLRFLRGISYSTEN